MRIGRVWRGMAGEVGFGFERSGEVRRGWVRFGVAGEVGFG